jgi:hypothetical protein
MSDDNGRRQTCAFILPGQAESAPTTADPRDRFAAGRSGGSSNLCHSTGPSASDGFDRLVAATKVTAHSEKTRRVRHLRSVGSSSVTGFHPQMPALRSVIAPSAPLEPSMPPNRPACQPRSTTAVVSRGVHDLVVGVGSRPLTEDMGAHVATPILAIPSKGR